jgi:hypothetical protein
LSTVTDSDPLSTVVVHGEIAVHGVVVGGREGACRPVRLAFDAGQSGAHERAESARNKSHAACPAMRKPPTSKFGAPRQREKFQQANARLINPTAVPLNAGSPAYITT